MADIENIPANISMTSDGLELFVENAEDRCQIIKDLRNIRCCPRCIMRFLGARQPFVYRCSPWELVERHLQVDLDKDVEQNSDDKICPGCLGILENFASKEFYEKVHLKVIREDFECSDFQFSVMIPVNVILRQHALYVFLFNKYEAMYSGKEEKIPSVKDVWKWCVGPYFSQLLGVPFQSRSPFDILLNFVHGSSDRECSFLLNVFPNTFCKRKNRKFFGETFTRANVAKAVSDMNYSQFSEHFLCPPLTVNEPCTCDITVTYDAVFVAGRYKKYSRHLSQTPWTVDGETKLEGSVQELLSQIVLQKFKPSDHKFSASGREDVDVRMLGLGRPFVIELINPHRVKFTQEDMTEIQKSTNVLTKDIAIRDLQIVTRSDVGNLKEGEIDKSKSYTAVCWCERHLSGEDLEMISSTKDLILQQKTPIRVLHRRTLSTRERVVYSMSAEVLGEHLFRLHLSTQAGTYVKEFVHGDFGRTHPSMRTLLKADCDILALDVDAVEIDWPPAVDPVQEVETTES